MTETTEAVSYTWRLTSAEVEATIDKLVKLNKRAADKGLAGRLDIHTERVEVKELLPLSGLEVTKIMWDTRVEGQAPSYGGWRFIAVLDWDAAAGLITRTVPGFDGQIDRESLTEGACDHCHMERWRNRTFLVEHAETGERRQVGSSCIKDFLGHAANPVRFFEDADSLYDSLGGCYGPERDHDYTPESVLAVAWAVVAEYGFVGSGDYGYDTPTKNRVLDILYPPHTGQAAQDARKMGDKLRPHIAKAAGQAQLIRDYILSDEFNGGSEYVTNLKSVVTAEYVGRRNYGLLCSAPQAWARSVERSLRRQAELANRVNEYIGSEGDKIELTASVKSIRYIDSGFGTTTLYTMVTTDGHMVKWFSSNGALGDEVTTASFTLRATIKKHDEYQGTKSTVITRAKLQVAKSI